MKAAHIEDRNAHRKLNCKIMMMMMMMIIIIIIIIIQSSI